MMAMKPTVRGCWASVWWHGFCETDGEWVLGVGLVE